MALTKKLIFDIYNESIELDISDGEIRIIDPMNGSPFPAIITAEDATRVINDMREFLKAYDKCKKELTS
jgi:hypothetical protein